MPEVWRKTETDYRIIVWQSTEPLSDLIQNASLTDKDESEFYSFRSETRKREWITVRNVLKFLLPDEHHNITYNEDGKPTLIGNISISISHSNEYIAVMIADGRRIGVDIEVIRSRIDVMAGKFMSEKELSKVGPDKREEKLHSIWGAKEVLYKIYSKGGIDFKNDLTVFPFEYNVTGNFMASIKKTSFEKQFIVYYEKIKEYMLVWSIQ